MGFIMTGIRRAREEGLEAGDSRSGRHLRTGQQFGERQRTLNGSTEYVYVDENDIVIYIL